ncbi:pyridoxal phosphate-dependent aminotransferase [Sinanaerobacter sp. ZZT-01]|uniref:pyridoxal phosphate-dependent aminotransferase n=1 Tax=Sinanaerobacter sp. ZZT-01 TaxID=3111540 RepID=UPI002D779279|nr:aminotransferase class I/II-fold pyridoxal phosphate-dependent enzyme [Sinanaerobacter sp. ZZT-01]WRR92439.1 aminotransferase class I/II-fold pyridoxal phosphate-dependent enzyme [Sinanaerobacter sp. ZZT-01]
MQELSKRTASFTESIIRKMTRISDQYGAVNLSQGFPDFDPPKEILTSLKEASMKGPHQYAVTWGAQNFREALAHKQEHFSGMKIDPNTEITVTCGSTEAMMAAMMAITNPGDQVIVFSPFYENYGADAILCGAEPLYVPLVPPAFHFDGDVLEAAFKKGAKALILCNPSNPCGKVFTREELKLISALAIKYDAYVITDEVYEHILYEPYEHLYLASFPGMRERTITCSSLSKTYSITGWRLGYVIAEERIIDRIKKVHDFLTVGAAAPLMEAAVTGLLFDDKYYKELQRHYTHMRDLFLKGLDEIGLPYIKPQGAYYVLTDISEFGCKNDVAFCEWLAKEVKVAAVPGSAFFKEQTHSFIRFHFAKKDETLQLALQNLSEIYKKADRR